MEAVLIFAVGCLLVGAYYGKRAPDDAEYEVDPAKRGMMQFVTFVFMTLVAAVAFGGGALVLGALVLGGQ